MITVTVFLAPGFEEIEAVTPVDYLRRAGAEVTTVAVPVEAEFVQPVPGSHGISIQADMRFDEYGAAVGKKLPDAVFIPGGMPGAVNVGNFLPVVELIRDVFSAGKIVSAICAAPAVVLSRTGILSGRKYTCYPGMEKQIETYCGASAVSLMKDSRYEAGVPFVTDGNLVTGRGPGAAEQFAMELVRILLGSAAAESVRAKSVQR
jgi:4-methyl-5(b-hydroxyethyl)-thiazole monophosphate biosynthesis